MNLQELRLLHWEILELAIRIRKGLLQIAVLVWSVLFPSQFARGAPQTPLWTENSRSKFSSSSVHPSIAERPFTAEDALGVRTFAPWTRIALSPDGKWVAYTVQDNGQPETATETQSRYFTSTGASSMAINCDIWLSDTRTGESKNLTEGQGTNWDPVWSPNGKYLAFYSDRGGVARVWVWERDSGQFRQMSESIERSSTPLQVPRWTPDSRQLVAKVLPAGVTVERAAQLMNAPAPQSVSTNPGKGSTAMVYRSIPAESQNLGGANSLGNRGVIKDTAALGFYAADIGLIDVATSKIVYLTRDIHPANYWISPDGKYLAYMDFKGHEAKTEQQIFDLGLYSFVDHSYRILISDIVDAVDGMGMSVSWSPDSRSLAYITDGQLNDSGDSQLARGDCYVVSINAGKPRNVTKGDHPPFQSGMFAPLWDPKGEAIYLTVSASSIVSGPVDSRIGTIWKALVREGTVSESARIPGHSVLGVVAASGGEAVWSPDGGRSFVVGTQDEMTRRAGFWKIEISSGAATKLFEDDIAFSFPVYFAISTDVSRDGEMVAYFSENAQHPQDIYTARSDLSDRHRLTNINPQLEGISFGASRPIEYASLDGTPLHAALLLPANYEEGKRYPLIFWVYSGTFMSREVYRFGLESSILASLNLQVLASHGYAVLVADAPLKMGTPVLDLTKAAMPALARVVELGIADPDRLGIMGHSYGGYSTLALVEQTDRFKAAVDYAGLSDLISYYGRMDRSGMSSTAWAETGQGRMGGTPWQFANRYIENSPIFHLDRVQTAVLLVHGELDPIPCQQAEEAYVGLRRLGKEVVYVKYAGEGHMLKSPANVIDFWNRVIDWFEKHMKGGSS